MWGQSASNNMYLEIGLQWDKYWREVKNCTEAEYWKGKTLKKDKALGKEEELGKEKISE